MRVVTHNVWVGQPPAKLKANLRRLIKATAVDDEPPVAIALQEAHRLNDDLPGYRRFWIPGSDDDRNNQLLIRREGVKVHREHLVHAPHPWIGPKHQQRHDPRRSPGATIEVDDRHWIILATHLIPNDGRNPMAADGEWDSLTVWANGRMEDRPLVMLADWNSRKDSPDLRRFAHRTNTEIHLKGIDGALTRNCRVDRIKELDGKYGSDGHNPVVLDLEADK